MQSEPASPSLAVAAMTALGGGEALARAKVGVLTCNVAPGIGLIVGSSKSLSCSFNPSAPGPNERYSGRISRVGVDVGITGSGVIVWGVFAPESGYYTHGALAGHYGGASAQATLVAGLGANVLVGGGRRSFALQPFSVTGQIGANFAVGITGLDPLRALASPRAASPSSLQRLAGQSTGGPFRVFGTPAKRSCQPRGSLRPSPERRPGHLDCGGVEGTIEGRHRRWETAMAAE